MSKQLASQDSHYFEEKYVVAADPWNYRSSIYEADKYDAALAALPCIRYRHCLEIGCSIGEMTDRLARRCTRVTAVDCSMTALREARRYCGENPNILFDNKHVPASFPDGSYDLITLCEVGYYLSHADLRTTCNLIVDALESGGHLLLVHWRGDVDDGPLSARVVHDYFRRQSCFTPTVARVEPMYRMDILTLARDHSAMPRAGSG